MLHHVDWEDLRQQLHINMTEEERQSHQNAVIKANRGD